MHNTICGFTVKDCLETVFLHILVQGRLFMIEFLPVNLNTTFLSLDQTIKNTSQTFLNI